MPLWSIIYLVLYSVFVLLGDGLTLRDDGIRWRGLSDLVGHLLFAILFAGYWLPPVLDMLGVLAPIFFIAASVWEVCSGPSGLRKIWRDPAFSRRQRIGITFLTPLLAWPLFVIAGIGVFRFYGRG